VAPPIANPNIQQCMQKLAYKPRTKQYLINNNHDSPEQCIPQLYIKLTGWIPPPATNTIETKMTEFERNLKIATTTNQNINSSTSPLNKER
jgi:hypothetical protein